MPASERSIDGKNQLLTTLNLLPEHTRLTASATLHTIENAENVFERIALIPLEDHKDPRLAWKRLYHYEGFASLLGDLGLDRQQCALVINKLAKMQIFTLPHPRRN